MEKGEDGRGSVLRPRELIPALAALAVLAAVFLWRAAAPPGAVAVISLDGAEILRVPLDEDAHLSLREDWGVPVEFEVADGRIRYVNVICPDHICERTGWVRRDGETAVCMPNRVVLTVVEGG